MRTLRVAAVQMESSPGDKAANFVVVEEFVRRAVQQKVQLLIFPECCLTGYWFLRKLTVAQLVELSEPVLDGPSSKKLIDLARRYQISLGAGLIGSGPPGVFYNSYVVAMPDGKAQRHRKLHAFEHPSIHSGSEYTVFDIPEGFRLGVLHLLR